MASISIVTVVYNDLIGLQSTVNSIDKVCSSYSLHSNLEHIIIDGNSNDGSAEYANSLAMSRNIRTIAFSENDHGIYDAMNKGIKLSSGDGVIFLNAGDFLHSDCDFNIVSADLDKALLLAEVPGIVYSSIFKIGVRELLIKPRLVLIESPRMPGSHQAMLYKRSVLLRFPFDVNFSICGDYDNFCQIRKNIGDFRVNNRIISIFNAGGISTRKPIKLFFESYSISVKRFRLNFFRKLLIASKLIISLLLLQFIWLINRF